jgi:hypothetical protein
VTKKLSLGIITFLIGIALSIPPFRWVIEQNMTWHMGFQVPLLVISGWLVFSNRTGKTSRAKSADWLNTFNVYNQFGLTGFLLCTLIFSYWMLPLALDKAVVQPMADVTKILTLFMSGAILKKSFQTAPTVVQLFFIAYWSSMLIWLGIYFTTTDVRLCNVYSLDSQIMAGRTLTALGIGVGTLWVAKTFLIKRTRA